jgi:hypothetical protein
MTPTVHVFLRVLIALGVGVAAKFTPPLLGTPSIPTGAAYNIGFGTFFVLVWVWEFPWAEVMLLTRLEEAQKRLLPHQQTLLYPECTLATCALSPPRTRCVRIRHMREQTVRRIERLNEHFVKNGTLFLLTLTGIFIAATMIPSTDSATANSLWQVVQALLALVALTWSLGGTFAEVAYQRSLNFDLIGPSG